jgi:hypothetical protein
MTIVLLVEGDTETALRGHLKRFLDVRAEAQGRPKIALRTKDIMTLNEGKLRGRIRLELRDPEVTAVVGLIDVYPRFHSAEVAKTFLRQAADNAPRFHAHAAQYDVEAWLLPYWESICQRVGVNQRPPGDSPELVNLERPPSKRLAELYGRARNPARKYVKTLEMYAILENKDLTIAAGRCPEFKALLNTLLMLGGLNPL